MLETIHLNYVFSAENIFLLYLYWVLALNNKFQISILHYTHNGESPRNDNIIYASISTVHKLNK